MIKRCVFFLLCSVPFLFSCLKEPQSPSWEMDISAPLFKTSLGIQNLFADSLLDSDANMLVHIVYRSELYDFLPDSILSVPDTITYENYSSPFNITFQPGQLFINKNEEKVYKFGNSKITKLRVNKGNVKFEVTNTLAEAVQMTYTINSATKNGQPFEITELVPAASIGAQTYTKYIDISGYTLDMRGVSGLGANTIATNIKVRLNPNGVPTQITTNDVFASLVKFDEFEPAYVKGSFEPVDINVNSESKMDVFSIIKSGQIHLEDVFVDLVIDNGFGLDARLKINEIISRNSITGQDVPLHSAILGQSINISRAIETGSPNAPVVSTKYPIDFTYTNIKQLIENQPDYLLFDITGMTNPLGNISGGNDFYYHGYGLKIFFNLDVPLSIKANALTLRESFDFSMEEPDYNKITKGEFKLVADNGFPFDADVQLFLFNEDDFLLDSLLFNNRINAAPLNSNLIVESVLRSIVEIPLSNEKLNKLYQTKRMMLEIVFNTDDNDFIKLYDFYKIDLKLTGDFQFLVKQ